MLYTSRLLMRKPENPDPALIGDINYNADILDDVVRYDENESITGTWSFINTGLTILDIDSSHVITIKPGSNLSAARILTINTGDADRIVYINGDVILDNWFNQGVRTSDFPHFNNITIQNNVIASGTINSSGVITGTRYISNIATGTAPVTVSSTTLNSNLNADFLDGQHGSYYAAAGTSLPSGISTSIQYNNAGAVAGDYRLTYDNITNTVSMGNLVASGNIDSVSADHTPLTSPKLLSCIAIASGTEEPDAFSTPLGTVLLIYTP